MKYIVSSIVPTGDSSKFRIQSISNAVIMFYPVTFFLKEFLPVCSSVNDLNVSIFKVIARLIIVISEFFSISMIISDCSMMFRHPTLQCVCCYANIMNTISASDQIHHIFTTFCSFPMSAFERSDILTITYSFY